MGVPFMRCLVALAWVATGAGLVQVPDPPAAAGTSAGRTPSALVVAPSRFGAPTQLAPGLSQEVAVSYRVDPAALATTVQISATVSNTSRDLVLESWGFPAPAEASNLSARTSGGASRSVQSQPVPDTDQILHFYIPLGAGVFPGDSVTLEASYRLARQPPRAATLSQANEALFMFPVWALGDPGRSSLEVRIPAGYELDVVGGPLEQQEQGDEVVLTAEGISDPETFWAVVLAMDESRLVQETTEAAGAEVDLRAWPGDGEWVDFVGELITGGVPQLETLVGQPWPTEQSLTVVETMTPLARGYGGWYDPDEHAIRIGNELDAHLVLHELSHVWFNDGLFQERWVLEGLAEEYAHRAALGLGRTELPGRPGPVPERDRRVPLVEWSDSPAHVDETNRAVEEYGYATSWHVVGTLVEEVGLDAMRDVIQLVADRGISYVGPDQGELTRRRDWRVFLDLLENVAGSEKASSVFSDYVVGPSERPELDERAEARTSYFALAERGGEWAPPFEVRWAMAEWGFEEATAAMDLAAEVLDLRDQIEKELDGLDVAPLALQEQYEATSHVDRVVPVAEDTLEAAEAYREAEQRAARGRNLLETIGLWWPRSVDAQLDDAREALAEGTPAASVDASASVVDRLDHAAREGALRVGAVASLAAGAALIPMVRRRLRRRRLDRDLQAFLEQATRPEHGGVG